MVSDHDIWVINISSTKTHQILNIYNKNRISTCFDIKRPKGVIRSGAEKIKDAKVYLKDFFFNFVIY